MNELYLFMRESEREREKALAHLHESVHTAQSDRMTPEVLVSGSQDQKAITPYL